MSWLSDGASWFLREAGDSMKGSGLNQTMKLFGNNDYENFVQNEIIDKSDLRGTEVITGLSGFPILKDIIGGINGIEQLEDLYNRTGKTVAYAGSGTPGASGLGNALTGISRKIEEGTHDLFKFYTGVDDNSSSMFEQMSKGWNNYQQTYTKPQTR